MAVDSFSASALIEAPPHTVYAILADYHRGHPEILPKPPFVSLEVEEGGIGAGTVISTKMRVLGQIQTFRAVVTEPEPGRVLVEATDTGYVTTFTVEPRAEGRHSYVTFFTEMTGRSGVLGALERWFVKRLLQPTYVRELGLLAAAATRGA